MTRDEFIESYCQRSGITREFLLNWRKVLPCYCGNELCKGWATVPPDLVDFHMMTCGAPPAATSG
jgi:hypothetical protein